MRFSGQRTFRVNASTAPPAITVSKRLERDVSRSCFLYEAERDPAQCEDPPVISPIPAEATTSLAEADNTTTFAAMVSPGS